MEKFSKYCHDILLSTVLGTIFTALLALICSIFGVIIYGLSETIFFIRNAMMVFSPIFLIISCIVFYSGRNKDFKAKWIFNKTSDPIIFEETAIWKKYFEILKVRTVILFIAIVTMINACLIDVLVFYMV